MMCRPATSLHFLQQLAVVAPRVYGDGEGSTDVCEQLGKVVQEAGESNILLFGGALHNCLNP